ncbi:hypothetical protein HELRODRAFT_130418, partial [Helobdella robusta]|uniref:STAS domain-containing protein n=1 Tax=Helobdella robusta TaxID=6412 RepID=T1EHT8_HELRO
IKKKFPILNWLPKYRLQHLQGDFIAGLTVGLTVIPQGLALARVARLPSQYGLYTSFMGCFMYCLFGTSKDITVGPTAIMSILIEKFGASPKAGDPTYAIILTFFCGVIQSALGLLNLGIVVDYISHPVIDSFTVAAAVTIAEGQIKGWFGLHNIPREFIHELYWTLIKLPETRLVVIIIIILLLLLLLLFEFKYRLWDFIMGLINTNKTARNAIAVILCASTVYICNSVYHTNPFTTTSNITSGLPPFKFPNFTLQLDSNVTVSTVEILTNIGSGLAIVPLLALVECLAIGKIFAKKNGYKTNPSQEFFAIGVCNFASCFVSSFPVTGSFSRLTAVNSASGVMTTAGGLITGTLVILSLLFLTPYFHYIPESTLAVIIFCAVLDMISFKLPVKLWKVNSTFVCVCVCLFVCVCVCVRWGILCGIAFSLVTLICLWSRPKLKSFTPETYVILIDHGLTFPSVEMLIERTNEIVQQDGTPRAIIFDCSHVKVIDYSVIQGMKEMIEDFDKRDSIIIWMRFTVCVQYLLL